VLKDPKRINELVTQILAIEAEEAKAAGQLGYLARALVQATLPHKKTELNEFTRTNGAFTLSILAPGKIGLPYGTIPRLLLSWLTTEAVRTKEREIVLGDSLSDFMSQLEFVPTGGRWGSIGRLKEQMTRLFSSFVSCSYTDAELTAGTNLQIADEYKLWWSPKPSDQLELFTSTVTLSQKFFEEITRNPVPVDLRVLKGLRKSPLALDIYGWLTYRMSYLKRPTVIPWKVLERQFGADYTRTRDFKAAFIDQLIKVHALYPDAIVLENQLGLELRPSPTSVSKIVKKPVD